MYIIIKYARIKIQWHGSIWFERSLGQCLNYFNDYSIRLLVLYVYYLWEWFNHPFFNLETWYNYESGWLLPTSLSLSQRLPSSSLLRCPNYIGVGYMNFVSWFRYFQSQMNWTIASSVHLFWIEWGCWWLEPALSYTGSLRGDLSIPQPHAQVGPQLGPISNESWHTTEVSRPQFGSPCLPNCEALVEWGLSHFDF